VISGYLGRMQYRGDAEGYAETKRGTPDHQ
jgi:hypothetical protein